MVNGKSKGASFERLVCKHLSLWVTNGKKEDVFWRSAMSGGRATLLQRKGKAAQNSAGDITATGEEGHRLTDKYFIECKAYRILDIIPFVLGMKRGALWKFWTEACKQAELHNKSPLLIAKQNGLKPLAISYIGAHSPERCTLSVIASGSGASLFWFDELFPLSTTKPKVRKK